MELKQIISDQNREIVSHKRTKCLTTTKEQERVMQWANQIRDKKWVHIEALSPGNQF